MVPGLHLLSHLQRSGCAPERVVWFLTGRAVEAEVLADAEAELAPTVIERVPLALEPPAGGAPSLLRLLRRAAPETLRARRALRASGARVVLGLGGFTCLPAALAARSLGLPFALLEINAAAGRATRFLTPLAARVFHAWPDTVPARGAAGGRHRVLGPPLSPDYLGPPPDSAQAREARLRLGLEADRPLLLVLGGSQGALALNDFVRASVEPLLEAGVQVVHQVGPGRLDEGAPPRSGYLPVEYLRPVRAALVAADVVLCRGGASTVAEVGATGRPAVVVPYPYSHDRHQERNAQHLGAGADIVPQNQLGAATLARLIALLGPAGAAERGRMARASAASVPRDAGRGLAQALVELAGADPEHLSH